VGLCPLPKNSTPALGLWAFGPAPTKHPGHALAPQRMDQKHRQSLVWTFGAGLGYGECREINEPITGLTPLGSIGQGHSS